MPPPCFVGAEKFPPRLVESPPRQPILRLRRTHRSSPSGPELFCCRYARILNRCDCEAGAGLNGRLPVIGDASFACKYLPMRRTRTEIYGAGWLGIRRRRICREEDAAAPALGCGTCANIRMIESSRRSAPGSLCDWGGEGGGTATDPYSAGRSGS